MAASKNLTPEQRSQRSRIAALARWSKESAAKNAARGQDGLFQKFVREVIAHDPDVIEPELTRRAEARRREHMVRLSYAASKARGARRSDIVATQPLPDYTATTKAV